MPDTAIGYRGPAADKLTGIDATRGWAILLVMVVHSRGLFPDLPWPVARVAAFGWYGVQLFFVASAFTLLYSWYRHQAPLGRKIEGFFIRRVFRIAPVYYLAAFVYLLLRPPGDTLDPLNLLRALLFVDGWSPQWMGTSAGAWQVVPGGWSVSVEFSFYFVFPLLALTVTTLARALVFAASAFLVMVVAYPLGLDLFAPGYDAQGVDHFLFFWFPNQLIVFAIGFMLFHTLISQARGPIQARDWAGAHNGLVLILVAVGIVALAQIGAIKTITGRFPWLPTHVLISILFACAVGAILSAAKPSPFYVNRFMRKLGEVSFSAYLVHWAVLDAFRRWGGELFHLDAAGFSAIIWFALVFPLVVLTTFGISSITYGFIERPFMELGKRLTRRRAQALAERS